MESLYDISLTTIEGENTTLSPYHGRVLLIVNVASRCGFTPQYAKLEALYQELGPRGFMVLGFPCDQFLHQEPGTSQEIKSFAESCFRVTFPLFSKIHVKGRQQSPLYAYLAQHLQKRPIKFVPWNFTKILVSPSGEVIRQFAPTISFSTIRKAIETLLPIG